MNDIVIFLNLVIMLGQILCTMIIYVTIADQLFR